MCDTKNMYSNMFLTLYVMEFEVELKNHDIFVKNNINNYRT